jgi:RHS repeat-associated protein
MALLQGNNYFTLGDCRNSTGDLGTDKLFTGQRLDDTGLYYYGARYYDAGIGRFISADTIIPDAMNPQAFNRYSYVINNPLKYTDPTGYFNPGKVAAVLSSL